MSIVQGLGIWGDKFGNEKSLVVAFLIRLYQAFYVVITVFNRRRWVRVLSYSTLTLDKIEVIYLFVLASFLNTLHVTFRFVAFYQIGQACFFHETLSQLPYLYNPVDIFPRCSPTFHVFQENWFIELYLIL